MERRGHRRRSRLLPEGEVDRYRCGLAVDQHVRYRQMSLRLARQPAKHSADSLDGSYPAGLRRHVRGHCLVVCRRGCGQAVVRRLRDQSRCDSASHSALQLVDLIPARTSSFQPDSLVIRNQTIICYQAKKPDVPTTTRKRVISCLPKRFGLWLRLLRSAWARWRSLPLLLPHQPLAVVAAKAAAAAIRIAAKAALIVVATRSAATTARTTATATASHNLKARRNAETPAGLAVASLAGFMCTTGCLN